MYSLVAKAKKGKKKHILYRKFLIFIFDMDKFIIKSKIKLHEGIIIATSNTFISVKIPLKR